MTPEPSQPSEAQLLADLAWVRRLAMRMLGDPNLADEVVQDTWLDVRRAPANDRPRTAAWLVTVAKNRIRRLLRTDRRRTAREAVYAEHRHPDQATTDPAEIVARAELHRELIDAVMSLVEPYRSTVLLRYLDELPATEIATRQGIGHDAARQRISRGLQLLRERLAATHRGGFAAWCTAWTQHLQSGVAAVTASPSLLLSILLMTHTKWLLSGLAIGASLLAWFYWPGADSPHTDRIAGHLPSTVAADELPDPTGAPSTASRRVAALEEPTIVVQVADADQRPCRGALVMTLRDGELVHAGLADPDGQARLPLGPGAAELLVAQPGTTPVRARLAPTEGRQRVLLAAGRQVAAELRSATHVLPALRLEHDRAMPCWDGLGEAARQRLADLGLFADALLVAPDRGRVAFRGLPPQWSGALVATAGYTLRELTQRGATADGATVLLLEPVDDLVLQVSAPLPLAGRLLTGGTPAAGLTIRWHGEHDESTTPPVTATSNADGRFVLGLRRDGNGEVGRGRLHVASGAQTLLQRAMVFGNPGTAPDLGDLELGRPLRVRVSSADAPLAAATVALVGPAWAMTATTDAQGLARFAAVPAAARDVTVQASRHGRRQLPLPSGEELAVTLLPANELVVQVLAADGTAAGDLRLRIEAAQLPFAMPTAAARTTADEPFVAVVGLQEDGSITLTDLVPGARLQLTAVDATDRPLGTSHATAPATARSETVALRTSHAPRRWLGVVRDDSGRPVPRARIHLESARGAMHTRTDGDGRFALGPLPDALAELHVEVYHPLFVEWAREDFAIEPGSAPTEIVLQRGRQLRAIVRQEDGSPVTAPAVQLEMPDGSGSAGRTAAPGDYVFEQVPRRAGTLTLRLGGREFRAAVTPHDDLVELRVPNLAVLSIGLAGQDLDAEGTLLCVAVTPLEPAGAVDRRYCHADDLAAQNLSLQLPAGRYRVQLERRRLGKRGVELLGNAQELVLAAGEARSMVLP
jgi:RNA polymerase sigma-70 factor (ECF subfamily)